MAITNRAGGSVGCEMVAPLDARPAHLISRKGGRSWGGRLTYGREGSEVCKEGEAREKGWWTGKITGARADGRGEQSA